MVMYCPYCDIEINDKLIESEDGCCPECGAFITPSMVVTEDEDDDEFDDEFADEDLGDEDMMDLGEDDLGSDEDDY